MNRPPRRAAGEFLWATNHTPEEVETLQNWLLRVGAGRPLPGCFGPGGAVLGGGAVMRLHVIRAVAVYVLHEQLGWSHGR
ncbi:MAG: hypothetical protein WD627_02220 [Actinomycetota bacterium]